MGILDRLFGSRRKADDADYELVPFRGDTGSGFFVRRLADGQRLRWEALPRREGLESVKVAGVSHCMDPLQHPTFAPGKPLALIPEPDNPQDPNAIGVWNEGRTRQAGYLPHAVAKRISKQLAQHDDDRIGCLAIWESRKGRQRVGLRVLIVRSSARVQGVRF